MKLMEWKKAEKKFKEHTLEEQFILILSFFVFLFFAATSTYGFYYELDSVLFVNDSSTYIKESGALISIIALLPFTIFAALAVLQKIVSYGNKTAIQNMIKSLTWGIPISLISIFPANLIIESNLKARGYSYCYWYTGPSVRNADVWMKDKSFCLQDGSLIRSDVLDWFDTHKELGTEPTLEALNKFIIKENSRIKKEINGH